VFDDKGKGVGMFDNGDKGIGALEGDGRGEEAGGILITYYAAIRSCVGGTCTKTSAPLRMVMHVARC